MAGESLRAMAVGQFGGHMIKLDINGREQEVDADGSTPLLYVLRDDLGLNGAKFGCGLGQWS